MTGIHDQQQSPEPFSKYHRVISESKQTVRIQRKEFFLESERVVREGFLKAYLICILKEGVKVS